MVRHWRGELPLAISFWINGLVLGALFVYGAPHLVEAIEKIPGNHAFLAAPVIDWGLCSALVAWQIVGIWRAAGVRIRQKKLRLWAWFCRTYVVIEGFFFALHFGFDGVRTVEESARQVAWLNQHGRMESRWLNSNRELELTGGIGRGMAGQLEALLGQYPQLRVVHVNLTRGGLVSEARKAGELIRSRGLHTYTSATCASACTLVFMGGTQRVVGRAAKLGFHASEQPGIYGWERDQMQRKEWLYLVSIGVDRTFASRVIQTRKPDLWYPTTEELLHAGVITGVTDGLDLAQSGNPELVAITPQQVDDLLLKDRFYRVVKDKAPDSYARVRDEMVVAFQGGRTMSDAVEETMPRVVDLFTTGLPTCDDAAQLRMTRVLVDVVGILKEKDPALCVRYVESAGQPGDTAAMMKLVPKRLRDELFEAMADVIASADPKRPPVKRAKFQRAIDQAVIRSQATSGPNPFLAFLEDGDTNPTEKCVAAEALFSALLSLPAELRSPGLRGLFAPDSLR